ncbi:hypothetical protein RvY_07270-4 [Ramazzottius varieornatus]|uniref:Uncharacterized protein n=1 Tax=Ramazzottius varieornatus TaxID=947166 RepID=A0A1D1V6J7_RAMVA|nr:hypothetical protein RvY_07270-4 [Ramazzottius varieornatus]
MEYEEVLHQCAALKKEQLKFLPAITPSTNPILKDPFHGAIRNFEKLLPNVRNIYIGFCSTREGGLFDVLSRSSNLDLVFRNGLRTQYAAASYWKARTNSLRTSSSWNWKLTLSFWFPSRPYQWPPPVTEQTHHCTILTWTCFCSDMLTANVINA